MDSFSSSSFFARMPSLSPPSKPAMRAHIPLSISSAKIEERPATKQNTQQEKVLFSPLDGREKEAATSGIAINSPLVRSKARPRSPQISLPATVCNAFDDIINMFIDPPVPRSIDPKHVLAHNFSPVDELPPTECLQVEGALPPCLDGAYIRNGPNPRYLPRGPYHLFDGDGMLHSLRISKGRATLCSRYVRTYKFSVEETAGGPVLPNFFSSFNGYAGIARGAVAAARVLTGQFNLAQGIGLANTSLVFFAGKLFALGESDLPYIVNLNRDGEIETEGRWDFDGNLFMGMTAHPKIDLDTREMFAFRYGPVPPYLTYFRFDANGSKQPDVPIFSIGQPALFHDFAITKRYAVFVESQIVMDPMEMILRGGSPVGADPTKVPRIGILPRYATTETEIKWFDVPGFNMMHSVNAWEEDGALVLVAPNLVSVQHTLERMELLHCCVEKVRIDLKTGHVSRIPLSVENLEFGVINPAYTGKKNRYAYMGTGDPMPMISGIVKLDLEAAAGGAKDGAIAKREFGAGCYGGEPFFVARNPDDPEAAEDDGYVVSYIHDGKIGGGGGGESRFVVMDARSPELEIVASVKLPGRVPYGFHGLFVSEKNLRSQRHW